MLGGFWVIHHEVLMIHILSNGLLRRDFGVNSVAEYF